MTGQEAVIRIMAETLHLSRDTAVELLQALRAEGYVCVPLAPTELMVSEAWASALAENAAGVWETMIGTWEGTLTAD